MCDICMDSIITRFIIVMKATPKTSLKTQIYEKLKRWDRKRAQILRYHKKATEQISESVQRKVQDSKQFLCSLQTLLDERASQLKAYCSNSVVDSSLVFDKNKLQSFNSHYQLLKTAFSIQADLAKQSFKKLHLINQVINQLNGAMAQNQSQSWSSSDPKNQQSSLLIARGNIKYLIECELPQIIQEVVAESQKLSQIYNAEKQKDKEKDLYFGIDSFVRVTTKQTNKHREIGRELVNFVSTSMKRQMAVQSRIRACLKKWSQVDGPLDSIFIEQLTKKQPSFFVKNFYDLQDMSDISYEEPTIEDFLINFKIQQFNEHERLKLCDVDGFYNSKIQSRIIITADCFMHLIRINAFEPDFSQLLNSDLIVKKTKQCSLVFIQYKKKFYFKKQRQYQFSLEFNSEEDLHHVKTIIEKISDCKIQ